MKNVVLYILLITGSCFAQLDNTESISKTGTTSAQFLKIGADARGASMGNAFTAMSGGISSMYWNPAGMTSIRKMEAVFLSSDWIAGITYNYTAFGLNLGNVGIVGLSMTSLSTPEDLVRTVEKPNGTGEYFDANDLAINLSYARRLTNKFSLGGRWLRGYDNYGAGPRDSRTSYVGGNNIIALKLDFSRPITLNDQNPIYFNLFNLWIKCKCT